MASESLTPHVISLLRGEHGDPFHVLGPHVVDGSVEIRAFMPEAMEAWVVPDGGDAVPMERVHGGGVFRARFPGRGQPFPYRYRIRDHEGDLREIQDPYTFWVQLGELDIYLMGEGSHLRLHERLGAHLVEVGGVRGVRFAVWAPNARRVSVVGDFNGWDGRRHPMRSRGKQGIWEIFLPGMGEGDVYKFEILSRFRKQPFLKADPFAFQTEPPPDTASVVCDIDSYTWRDEEWMAGRGERQGVNRPLSVYEVHLGSWMRAPHEDGSRPLSYKEHARLLVDYVRSMGYTHVEFLPVMEHPFGGSWGYQVTGFFSPTGRWGRPRDLMMLIDAFHRAGIGVILDWVPGHFPTDAHGLSFFDGTHLFEHADPRKGFHPDWKTYIFNHGRSEVSNFLLSNALFWLGSYHVDGLRLDAVASMLYLDYSRPRDQWVPNEHGGKENLESVAFLQRFNRVVHEQHPDVLTIAEESTSWPSISRPVHLGGLGFDFKWNMGWMHDTLRYFGRDPIFRKFDPNDVTFSMLYAYSERFVLALSHDEVVHGKGSLFGRMPGDRWRRLANLRAYFGFQYGHPGKKHLFMGGELGQIREWDHDGSLDWRLLDIPGHQGLMTWVEDLNRLYVQEPSLWEADDHPSGFQWIDCSDHMRSIYSFVRRAKDPEDFLVFVCNFTPVPRRGYRLGVPRDGEYEEVLNSDSERYGGSNTGNLGRVEAEAFESHGRPWSLVLTLPPLSVLVLKPEPLPPAPKAVEAPAGESEIKPTEPVLDEVSPREA